MRPLSWESVFDQLRPLGIELPDSERNCAAAQAGCPSPPSEAELTPQPRQAPNANEPTGLATILAAARRAGVQFMERVSDGALIAEGLNQLTLLDRRWLEANWDAAHSELLPESRTQY
jgi:hypothetical protein